MSLNIDERLIFRLILVSAIVLLADFVRLWPLSAMGYEYPYTTFYPAVMLSAVYGGGITGIYAAVLSILLVFKFLFSGQVSLYHQADLLGLVVFSVNGLIFSFIGEVFRRMHKRTMEAHVTARRLSDALDHLSVFVYMKDKNSRYTYANRPSLDLLHCNLKDIIGKNDDNFFPEETVTQLRKIDRRVLENGESTAEEIYMLHPHGERVYWEVKTPVYDRDNNISGLCGISTDITQRKLREDSLRESEERFRSIFNSAAIGMALVSLGGRFLQVNQALCQMIGYSNDELLEKNFQDITHPEDLQADLALIQDLLSGKCCSYQLEKRYFHKNGHEIWILLTGSVVHDANEQIKYFTAQMIDITDRKLLLKRLEQQAHQDYLTGLANRRHFYELGEVELNRCRRYHHPLTVLMLDIDHFKQVNDTYGHKAGDLVLQELSLILRQNLRNIDIIGRLGGEEFAVILPQTTVSGAKQLGERIRLNTASTMIQLDSGATCTITISVGIAVLDDQHKNIDQLLNDADAALYHAKNTGRNRVCMIEKNTSQ